VALCLTAVCLNPVEPAVDEVDLVEINHFFDEQGRLVFDQIIFYEWCSQECRYQVRDWRLLKTPGQVPLRNWRDGNFVAIWHDFKERDLLRRVNARMIRETWTQYDPELVEREFLPEGKRRELSKLILRHGRSEDRSERSAEPRASGAAVNASPQPAPR
jgi:hypothetical protein